MATARKSATLLIVAGALLAGAAVAAYLVFSHGGRGTPTVAPTAPNAGGLRGALIPTVKMAPPFTLESERGRPLRLVDQRGKLVLIAFLYTHCIDVCPVIATGLDSIVRGLGHDAASVRVLAVSVDPAGDTLQAVRRYMRSHRLGPQFHYLIGTRQQLQPVWRDYNIAVREQNVDEVVHAAPVLLVDRRGRARVYFQRPESVRDRSAIAHDLRLLLRR